MIGEQGKQEDENLLRVLKGRLHNTLKTMNNDYASEWLSTYDKLKMQRHLAMKKQQEYQKAEKEMLNNSNDKEFEEPISDLKLQGETKR